MSRSPTRITDVVSVIGFIRSGPLDRLPIPPELGSDFTLVIYADDGVTRIGEFVDGSPVLDG